MTIRDLTEEQRKKLLKLCLQMFRERNKSRPKSNLFDWNDYRVAFSDGVQQTLKTIHPN